MISPDQLQDVEVVAEDGDEKTPPFVRIKRLLLRHRYRNEQYSATYSFDMIEGQFVDAVVVVIYQIDDEGKVWVGLRRGVRPSIYLRKNNPAKASLDGQPRLVYLELVAGGIEYGDMDTIGIDGRAALEVKEEAGFEIRAEDIVSLGGGTFSSPGSGMEKLHYRAVQVDVSTGRDPRGDGHPLEEVGDFQFQELSEAIYWCRCGMIEDSKTEIGLYRLANYLGYHPELALWSHELPTELKGSVRSLGLEPNKGKE
ncbi:MAG: NUDIX hydrolase [Deltaproteobacteria bacterium]|nr:MAG: NUDIX hydrolase [Deltaproteobacteria bacterium]